MVSTCIYFCFDHHDSSLQPYLIFIYSKKCWLSLVPCHKFSLLLVWASHSLPLCVWDGQMLILGSPSSVLLSFYTLHLEVRTVIAPESLTWLGLLVSRHQEPSCLCFPSSGITGATLPCLAFYVVLEDLNSDLHICWQALLTEPSFQPLCFILREFWAHWIFPACLGHLDDRLITRLNVDQSFSW